ncbi:glycosyl hydrolase family 61-domain-containing protein [Infundibulicybe gibba]|nr:glycosyl hydrolase family 61-domain-containing protein [Infundibulicybe gibba]
MISAFFVPLLAAASVAAHGFVSTVTIDGKVFKGTIGKADKPADSVIRQVTEPSPIKGAQNPAVNCGNNAQASSLVADAQPGSQFTFDWTTGALAPHNTGPMLTYMASCGETTCDKFDSTKAQWFKIQQVGRKANGQWAQADLMKGGKAEVTLPSNIAPGNYLIRHEIIALHIATSPGGAEFYASCTQLKVGGNQNGVPTASELVSFPGAYSDTDPGILDAEIFNPQAPYTFPGPKIASFITGDAPSPAPSGGPAVNGSSAPSPTSSDSPAANGSSAPSLAPSPSGSPAANDSSAGAPAPSASAPSSPTNASSSSINALSSSTSAPSSSASALSPSANAPASSVTGTKGPCRTAVANASAYRPRRHSRIMRNLASKHIH